MPFRGLREGGGDGVGLGCVGLNVPEALRALAGLWRVLIPL